MLSSSSRFLLFFCFAGIIAEKINKCVDEDDCILYTSCERAKELVETDKSNATRDLFHNAFCRMHPTIKMPMVCCSVFQLQPNISFEQRFAITAWSQAGARDTKNNDPDDVEVHPNVKLLPTSCGDLYTDRIVGGIKASLYEFPWMALISYKLGEQNDFQCAGSLINARYVLTAAHCVQYRLIVGVRIGEYNIREKEDCQDYLDHCKVQDLLVQESIVHENYEGPPNYSDDIALLRLEKDVDFTQKNADPICLPVPRHIRNNSIANMMGTVAGWGLTENDTTPSELLKVTIPIHSQSDCQDHYGQLHDAEPKRFCAGLLKKDSCRGDSGGPLLIKSMYRGSSKFVQVGIVSVGTFKCGLLPGVYTDVRKYMNWILDNIKE